MPPGLTDTCALVASSPPLPTRLAVTPTEPPRPPAVNVVDGPVSGLTLPNAAGTDQRACTATGLPNASSAVTAKRREPRGFIAVDAGSMRSFAGGPGATVCTWAAVVRP